MEQCETVVEAGGVRCPLPAPFLLVTYCQCGDHGSVETYANCREHLAENLELVRAAGDTHDIFYDRRS